MVTGGANSIASVVLYNSNGFEASAGYVANQYLQGQPAAAPSMDQWVESSQDTSNPPYPVAEVVTYPSSTQQLVAVADDNIGSSDYGYWYPQAYDPPNAAFVPSALNGTNHVDVSWTEAWLSGATGNPFFGIEVFNGSNAVALAGVDVTNNLLVDENPTGTSELGSNFFNGVPGTYYNFDVDLNYTAQTYGVYINGSLIDTESFVTPTTAFTDADILTYALGSSNATGYGYFDNYLVTAVPEPTSLGIVSLALLLLTKRQPRNAYQ
jgi:hypothetical protein